MHSVGWAVYSFAQQCRGRQTSHFGFVPLPQIVSVPLAACLAILSHGMMHFVLRTVTDQWPLPLLVSFRSHNAWCCTHLASCYYCYNAAVAHQAAISCSTLSQIANVFFLTALQQLCGTRGCTTVVLAQPAWVQCRT